MCTIAPRESLVQCRACFHGLKVIRKDGNVSLVVAEFESVAVPAPKVRGGTSGLALGCLAAAALAIAAKGGYLDGLGKLAALARPGSGASRRAAGPGSPGDHTRIMMPVFGGVMPVRGVPHALFNTTTLGGATTSWSGKVGDRVPNTPWTINAMSAQQASVNITVANQPPVTLAIGQTYLGGGKPHTPPKLLTRADLLAKVREWERRAQPVARPQPQERYTPDSQGAPANVREIDASRFDRAQIESYATPGRETVIMFTSYLCGPSHKRRPFMMDWARAHPETTVVLAEIGATPAGRINFDAPVVQANGISHVPYFYVLDKSGRPIAHGEQALERLGFER